MKTHEDIAKEARCLVDGETDPIRSAQIREARAKAELALMKLRPHMMYSTIVYETTGMNVHSSRAWTCTIDRAEQSKQMGGWHIYLPEGYGETPQKACEDFDRLWNEASSDDQ